MFVQLEEAELKRGRNKLINKYAKCPLLILNEWLINSMNEQEIELIFELVERRYQNKSTIFCTQFKIESWHTRLGGGYMQMQSWIELFITLLRLMQVTSI